MRISLAILMCFVFVQSQSLALQGGPPDGSSGTTSVTGTFAGVLLPSASEADGLGIGDALGLFVIGVPTAGIATGNFVYFTEGKTYNGTIQGIADPDRGTFRGLVKAQFDVVASAADIFGFQNTSTVPGGFANGQIAAEIGGAGALSARLVGTAELAVQNADPVTRLPAGPISTLDLFVDGFLQSTTVTAVAVTTAGG